MVREESMWGWVGFSAWQDSEAYSEGQRRLGDSPKSIDSMTCDSASVMFFLLCVPEIASWGLSFKTQHQ